MQRLITLFTLVALTALLAACGTHKSQLDIGKELAKEGRCDEAQPYFDDTIAQPDSLLNLSYAYFFKGECADRAGDTADAYENFYAAKIVACYAVAHDVQPNLNSYARSEFCQKIIPERLAKLAPDAGDVEKIEAKVDNALQDRYLERFIKRLD